MGNLGEETSKLQKSAGRNDRKQIWNCQSKLRMATRTINIAVEKKDWSGCQVMQETMQRWGEWTSEFFSKDKARLKPQILQIPDQKWNKDTMRVPEA